MDSEKYYVGQRVRVIAPMGVGFCMQQGEVGVVVTHHDGGRWPVRVRPELEPTHLGHCYALDEIEPFAKSMYVIVRGHEVVDVVYAASSPRDAWEQSGYYPSGGEYVVSRVDGPSVFVETVTERIERWSDE